MALVATMLSNDSHWKIMGLLLKDVKYLHFAIFYCKKVVFCKMNGIKFAAYEINFKVKKCLTS